MAKFSLKIAWEEIKEQTTSVKRGIVVVIAGILLIFGVIGTFIPLVPARLIAAPSLILLSIFSPNIYASLKRRSQNYPRIQSWFDRIRNWLIHRVH